MFSSRNLRPLLLLPLAFAAACGLFDSGSEARVDAGDPGGPDAETTTGDADTPGTDAMAVSDLPARVRDTIRSDDYTRLVLEVDVVEGMEPRDGVEADIETLFADILDKPEGTAAERDEILEPRGSDHAWSQSELQDLADNTYNLETDSETTALHTIWVDGHSDRDSEDGVILGLQFGRHIVLFKETIQEACESAALPGTREQTCKRTERGIWVHEIGHAIGLVDNGLPMVEDHKDDDRGAHDESDDCIMYWAYTGEGLAGRVSDLIGGGGDELGFDEACLNDVAAVRDAS